MKYFSVGGKLKDRAFFVKGKFAVWNWGRLADL
jgi:hypothetical protein